MAPGTNVSAAPTLPDPTLTDAPAKLAAYFQTLDTTGSAPLPAGFGSTGILTQESNGSISNYGQNQADKVTETWVHGVSGQSIAFSTGSGALVCGTVAISSVTTAAPGNPFVQPPDRSVWGSQVAPGSYLSLDWVGPVQMCVAQTDGLDYLMTNEGGIYADGGTST